MVVIHKELCEKSVNRVQNKASSITRARIVANGPFFRFLVGSVDIELKNQ